MTPPKLVDVTNAPPRPRARARKARFDPPAWLSTPGKAAFRRLLLDIEANTPDALIRGDVPTIALMAEAYAIATEAAKSMRAGGVPEVLEADAVHGGSNRKSPAWQVFNQASARYAALAEKYGLTLAARARLDIAGGGELPDEQDELDELLGG